MIVGEGYVGEALVGEGDDNVSVFDRRKRHRHAMRRIQLAYAMTWRKPRVRRFKIIDIPASQTFQQTVSGTLTTAGALLNQGQKVLTGTLTAAGTLLNQVQKLLNGTLTSAGALLNQSQKIQEGTLTTDGSLLKQTQKSLAGTLTTVGELLTLVLARLYDRRRRHRYALRRIRLVEAAAWRKPRIRRYRSFGVASQQFVQVLTGVLMFSGSLTGSILQAFRAYLDRRRRHQRMMRLREMARSYTLPVASRQRRRAILYSGALFLQSLASTLTTAGALLKQTQRSLTATLTTSGALATFKLALKSLQGTLTTAGTLAKQTRRDLLASLAPTGNLSKQTSKTFTGTVAPTGTLTSIKTALLSLVGTLSTSGALSRQAGKLTSGSLAPAGTMVKLVARILTGSVTPEGSLSKQTRRSTSGTLTLVGVISTFFGALVGRVVHFFARRDTAPSLRASRSNEPSLSAKRDNTGEHDAGY